MAGETSLVLGSGNWYVMPQIGQAMSLHIWGDMQMNFLDLVERLLSGFGLIGSAIVGLMTLAKLVKNLTRHQTAD